MIAALPAWSVRHPIGVVALTLAAMVLGAFAGGRLGIDLLPRIVYPEIGARLYDPGVPAAVMEDAVTRQLEEQLAMTDGVVAIQSRTTEGRSAIDLSFRYGTDIDQALRDASIRLERARRFLPDTDDPPRIFKRDPFQLPVAEYIVSSAQRDPVALRSWADYQLGPALLNLPGVAAAEVGGGQGREIQVIADQYRLAALGQDSRALAERLRAANRDIATGRLRGAGSELSGRTQGRFGSLDEIRALPLSTVTPARLDEVARVVDSAAAESLRIRFDQRPGIKLSIQKQPQANTVAVVERVTSALQRLRAEHWLPADIAIDRVADQARYIRHALVNASSAALSGALLAMLVVYLFLGSLRRTLIIGSAIPIAVLVTFILMATANLTFNIMTLGGLALGIGMLVDSTIVMLENIHRHQHTDAKPITGTDTASREVTGALLAATSTNLAAVLPFLFIGGLVGMLFRELIATISAAIVAATLVALTLVPALAARIPPAPEGRLRRLTDRMMERLQAGYVNLLGQLLGWRRTVLAVFIIGLILAGYWLLSSPQEFLPRMDEGEVRVTLMADDGTDLERMDALTHRVEALIGEQPDVVGVFATVGGFVFGRSSAERANYASLRVLLRPRGARAAGTRQWAALLRQRLSKAAIPGLRIYVYQPGIRGIRLNRSDEDISLRIQGEDSERLAELADRIVARLKQVPGLNDIRHSAEEIHQELRVRLDEERAARLGLDAGDVGTVLGQALEGRVIGDYIDGDRAIDLRLRLEPRDVATPADLESVLIASDNLPHTTLRLADLARVTFAPAQATILRDGQQRIVEINAAHSARFSLEQATRVALAAAQEVALPAGYRLYEAGNLEALQSGHNLGFILLGLALFLVLVAMAVQYESLRNPLIILLSAPFALIGVALGLYLTDLALSMPVWLGLIMLAGIVVNNAIVLVEFIELHRRGGAAPAAAILSAARLRLRPILMTTLTTVIGMLPLAMGLGEGAEMLRPLAVTIVAGLSVSMLVSLLLLPLIYWMMANAGNAPGTV